MLNPSFCDQIKELVGSSNVYTDSVSLLSYSYDATPNYQSMPQIIVEPGNTEEVSGIVKLCSEYEIPIVPRGSGTNLCAGTIPVDGGLVMLFNRMAGILEMDEENLTATVQPGVITQTLIEEAERKSLFYPPDPGSMKISTIGGNINECSGGLRGMKYGVTKDYVLGLTAVLPNGDIVKTGGKLTKDVAGYDLTKLLIGSEGTLAIVTEAILKLVPKPESKKTMLALFENIENAAQTVSDIIAARIIPATLEFLDQGTLQAVEDFAQIGLPTNVEAVLLIEQDGSPDAVVSDIRKIEALCRENGAFSVEVASTDQEAAQLMTARRAALTALSRLKPTTILEDATVPRSKVAEMVRFVNETARKFNLQICTFGHAGDGNLHPTCLTDARDMEELERVEQAFEEIFAKAVDLGGTITGEHGVGMMKAPYLSWKIGEEGVNIMKSIKAAFDPKNILNPGKMFGKSTRKRVVIRS
ncbi:glycolate oxidase subunit GlcD [Alkalihalobacillus sp. AL-G]|uniref:glycolate oxidase subunit GlcD n=1 Tax=Alkalihalobacillus sp. AL-G TaxID=2926399 RepID=UPI00272C22A0|nr:glycolate oxidase subunit GlcD [Alkalihalobacillus sp. AL-G]WLD91925.1 glycolate oxidase subunit GlcD [Alkalihalobacillus sp. AL-G]